MLAGEEVKIAPLGVEELAVSGQSSLVRLPAPDEGQGGGLVVEAEVPPPVVGALQPVEGAAGVHRDLAEHAQRAPSLRLPLGPDSDAPPPGEADVLVCLLVPVSGDGLPPVLAQLLCAGVAGPRAHLHCKLGFLMRGVEASCLDEQLVPVDGEEAVVPALGAEILTPHQGALSPACVG